MARNSEVVTASSPNSTSSCCPGSGLGRMTLARPGWTDPPAARGLVAVVAPLPHSLLISPGCGMGSVLQDICPHQAQVQGP